MRKLSKEQRDVMLRYILDHETPEGPLYDCLLDLDAADREITEEIRFRHAVEDAFKELRSKLAEAEAALVLANLKVKHIEWFQAELEALREVERAARKPRSRCAQLEAALAALDALRGKSK